MDNLLSVIVLGVVEGLTEFLPVSSTGHLILMDELLGFQGPAGKTFEIVIQLGAILAVCVVFWQRLWGAATGMLTQVPARHFVRNVLVAFLPAAVIGAGAHKYIKALLESPMVVAVSLVLGGIAMLVIERMVKKAKVHTVEDMSTGLSLKIGFCQCLAMVPGVSRSGATIMGAMLLGLEQRAAAEFSFFLAIPTMFGATVYSLYKAWADITFDGAATIAVGFVVAFLSALVVVKGFIAFISRHGWAPFAYYRIVVGVVAGVALMLHHG
jgi:undecaprenyl-diphosphatase